MNLKITSGFSLPLVLFLLVSSAAQAKLNATLHELKPSRAQAITSNNVLHGVNQLHLRKHKLDDDLSSKVFDRYIESLDSGKAYFLKSDIEEFEKYRFQLDEALQRSNLQPAFEIFNRYQSRISERLQYSIDLVTKALISSILAQTSFLRETPRKAIGPKT